MDYKVTVTFADNPQGDQEFYVTADELIEMYRLYIFSKAIKDGVFRATIHLYLETIKIRYIGENDNDN